MALLTIPIGSTALLMRWVNGIQADLHGVRGQVDVKLEQA
jgi:hypothetical protein